MAGIYFHIPFCKQACHYCDFHFSTSLKYKKDVLKAMELELLSKIHYLEGQQIETIYFGGGTPSLLDADEIKQFLQLIFRNFTIKNNPEITLEANPDDLTKEKIKELKNTEINRFSIGIQSFFEEDLRWMNRAHNSKEAEFSVKGIQDAGFENITLDLIYGFPLLSNKKWRENLQKVIDFKTPHLSAYSMTVEPKTALGSFVRKGIQEPMNEQQSALQYQMLCDQLQQNGFDQYEISNFSWPDFHSRHNSNYWKGIHYLGIGPSAHSFNGKERQWNFSNNALYLKAVNSKEPYFEKEHLSSEDQVNEYILTMLRTKWGMDLDFMKSKFPLEMVEDIKNRIPELIDDGKLQQLENIITLTPQGQLFADRIASNLFVAKNKKRS